MSIAAYNITNLLPSTQRPDRPATVRTEPYDIQNATARRLKRRASERLATGEGLECPGVAISVSGRCGVHKLSLPCKSGISTWRTDFMHPTGSGEEARASAGWPRAQT